MAETINGFLDGLQKAKQKGQAMLAKINSGKAPTEAEVKQLAKNEAYNLKTMEAAVAAFKKRNQAGIDQQALDQINALMVDKRAALAVLNTYKPTTRPEEIQAAVASIAGTNPPEIDKTIKRIPALEIEYNGKRYGDGKSINVEYSTFSKAFYLKNGVENAETSWILKNPASDVIKSFSGNLSSVDINFTEIIQGQELYNEQGLYFEITQDTRKLKVNIVTQKLILTGMTITDAKHRGRTATEGQTLYLVGHGGIKANVTATGFKSPFSNPNLSWSITNSNVTNPSYMLKDKSELNYDLGVTPVGIDRVRWEVEARNTLGTSKNIDVVVVDYYRTKHQVLPKSIENGINDVFTGFNSLNDAIKEFTKKDILTIKPKLTVNGSWYNEENPTKPTYFDAREGSLDAGLGIKVKVPLPPPYSQDLYIPLIGTIGKIGVFIDVDIDFLATAALKYEKQVESAIKVLEDPYEINEEKIANALSILKKEEILTPTQQELIDGLDNDVNKDETEEFLEYFARQYRRANQRIGGILRELSFDKDNSDAGLMAAIVDFVKTKGQIKETGQNTSWLSSIETESLIDQEGNFDKNLYRMLLFRAVANAFKNGTLVLKESYQYRPFEHYLLEKAYFQANRDRLLRECGLSKLSDFIAVIRILKKELDEQYHKTNQRFLSGENTDLIIDEDGGKKIDTPLRTRPGNFKPLDTYFERAGYINIIDLLSEVEKNTFYLSEIEHLGGKHAKGRPSHETFFAGLVGTGCNIKMDKMAGISKGINPSTLQLVIQLYLSSDSLKAANDCLINFKNQLVLPGQHLNSDQELHTVSDGQNFFIQVESLNSSYSYKVPGYDKMVTVNTAMDERFSIFNSQVISASQKEAAYLIDIHLKNTPVKSTIHSTDTGGYTEAVFGVLNMLDIFYAPRLKNLLSQQLYSFSKRREYKSLGYKLLPEYSINEKLIADNWEDILRLTVTLKSGKTTAHNIFKRLNAYAKQNPLLAAVKEYGRIIKSGFILRYYDDRELRQAIELQLSHIELVNRFAKAVFFGNNQEFMVGLKEEQEKVALARAFIQNAIIIWNYLYLSDQITQMKNQEEIEELLISLKNSTIIIWEHVNLHGIYDFTKVKNAKGPKFDMKKISQITFEKAA